MGAILCSHFIVGGLIGCTVDFGCRLVSLENYIAEEAFSARILQHSRTESKTCFAQLMVTENQKEESGLSTLICK